MKAAHLAKFTLFLLFLLTGLGCSFATIPNAGPLSFTNTTSNPNNSPGPVHPNNLYATTPDGRTVLLRSGTWEHIGTLTTTTTATLPNGQVVLLLSDGTWIYRRPTSNNSTRRRSTPPPASFLHIYQLGGGRGQATIFLDGTPVAALREKRYFVLRVPPGKYTLHIFNTQKAPLNITAINRRHIYLRNSDTQGLWGEKLQMMDAITGKSEILGKKLQSVDGTDVFDPTYVIEPPMSSSN